MENTVNVILEKKLDSYNCNNNDLLAPHELTVTITLNEYRDLVSKAATRDTEIQEVRSDNYTLRQEREELKKEIAKLREQLCELTIGKEEGAK